MKNFFLGLDCSTQSMSALIIEEEISSQGAASSKIIYEVSSNFEAEFPHYGIKSGVLPSPDNPKVQCTPPQLWVEALDSVFHKMKADKIDLSAIKCIGVSGQQHASVYLNSSMKGILANLKENLSLIEQLEDGYSRKVSPIWMDSSTTSECSEIAESLGGNSKVVTKTGSFCFERFTGPQIRKFYKEDPGGYDNTESIALVSSFIPSILAGKIVSIDPGDGAGMNLMNISQKKWDEDALEATAPNLKSKLSPVTASDSIVGTLCPYFINKFGLSSSCQVIPGTGDNPSSLIGLGLVAPGSIGISLGTSDTLFAYMSKPHTDSKGESHVFGSPADNYMVLSCYKNGSLAREKIKEKYNLTWEQFGELLESSEPGNQGKVLLPYFDTEIIPKVTTPGVKRFDLDPANTSDNVRALIEAQMTSMAMHSEWLGDVPKKIFVTGGASSNKQILQVMADVFNATVYKQSSTNAAGMGAALRAHHAWRKKQGQTCDWEMITSAHVPTLESDKVHSNKESVEKLKVFREVYREKEAQYLKELEALSV